MMRKHWKIEKGKIYWNKLKMTVLKRIRIKIIRYCDALAFQPFEFWPNTYAIYTKYRWTYLLQFDYDLSANSFIHRSFWANDMLLK